MATIISKHTTPPAELLITITKIPFSVAMDTWLSLDTRGVDDKAGVF